MPFSYLLLGHLLGDFTLQTDIIAKNKTNNWKWNIVHSVIVTVCMFLFSIPFGYQTMILTLLSGVLHYFIDFFKSRIPVKNPAQSLFYFIADQGVHIGIIYIISIFSGQNIWNFPFKNNNLSFLIILICVSSVSTILIQYILRMIFNIDSSDFFTGNEKIIGNMTRISAFWGFILSFCFNKIILISIPIIVIVKILNYKRCWYKWMAPNYFCVKLSLDMVISLVCAYILVMSK